MCLGKSVCVSLGESVCFSLGESALGNVDGTVFVILSEATLIKVFWEFQVCLLVLIIVCGSVSVIDKSNGFVDIICLFPRRRRGR